ncbi:MAG: hypothetical protein ACYDC2_02630 [Solirubrobacteraceae bacterium]
MFDRDPTRAARAGLQPAAARVLALVGISATLLAPAGCGGSSSAGSPNPRKATTAGATTRAARPTGAPATTAAAPAPPPAPALSVTPPPQAGPRWRAVARVHGNTAAWEAQRGGTTLLRFDQRYVRLDLHAGEGEPAGRWRYGSNVEPSEIHHLIAAFNGGFKFSTHDVGWMEAGHVAAPLLPGRASVVTYRDGTSEVGAWRAGIPAANRPVYSVLQNLSPLVANGTLAANTESCVQTCWGSTLGGGDAVARSGLGERADGQLVWAAGEHLTPAELSRALAGAGARWAAELDINPAWVAGYLYAHGPSGPRASPVVPGQNGIAGMFLQSYTRDFFAVTAR